MWQAGSVKVVFDAELWLWDARRTETWTFVSIPASQSEEIRDLWAQLGWENSQLGFPTSDEFAIAGGGRRSNFQNGCYIDWFPATGATAYCNSIPTF